MNKYIITFARSETKIIKQEFEATSEEEANDLAHEFYKNDEEVLDWNTANIVNKEEWIQQITKEIKE